MIGGKIRERDRMNANSISEDKERLEDKKDEEGKKRGRGGHNPKARSRVRASERWIK